MHHRPRSRRLSTILPWALAGLGIASALPSAHAQASYKWTGATNSNWNNAGNWDTTAPYAGMPTTGAADILVDVSQLDLTANKNFNLNNGTSTADRTVGTIRFGDTNAVNTTTYDWTVNGSGGAGSSPKLILASTTGPGTIEVVNGTTTLNAVLAGTVGLKKIGAGTLVLNNAANTLSGGINLNAGALTFIDGALGSNALNIGGSVTVNWSGSTADLSSRIKLGDGFTLTLGLSGVVSDNTVFASPIQTGPLGTGGLVKLNASNLTISAANTYTGGTKVNNGRLILIGGDNRLSVAGALAFGNGSNSGVVQLGDATGASNQAVTGLSITGTGTANAVVGGAATTSTFTINNATAITAANAPSFGGLGTNENNLALTKTGAGALTLTKASTFTGDVNVNGGRLIITSMTALGGGSKTVTISGSTNAPSLQLNSAAGLALPASFSFRTSNDDATTPAIVNTAGTNVLQGDLALASGGYGTGQTRVLVNSGSLVLGGRIAPAADAATDRTLILDAATGTSSIATGTLADTGGIKLGVNKEGAGTWFLTGSNSYSGPVAVNGGRLNVTTAHAGTGAISIADGATLGVTLAAAGQSLAPASLTLGGSAGGTLAFDLATFSNPSAALIQTGLFTVNGSSSITVAGTGLHIGPVPLVQYSGAIGGAGFSGLPSGNLPSSAVPSRVTANLVDDAEHHQVLLNVTKFDVPRWTGQNSNVWDINDGPDPTTGSGTVNWREATSGVDTRYLQSGSSVDSVLFDDTAGVPTSVILNDSLTPTSVTVNTSTNAFVFTGSGRLTGATSLLKQGTSTLTLLNTGGNDFSGTTTIAAGVLQVGDGATTGGGTLGVGPIVNQGTLRLNRPDDFSVVNLISGSGTVEKLGASLVTLTGNNSAFTGPIVVSAGFLKVGSANALGDTTGDTTVNTGAELNITGFAIAEPVKLNGGTLSSLSGSASNLTGPLTLSSGGKVTVLSGTLTLSGAVTGTGGLAKTDAGTLTLNGTSSFSGGLQVQAGTVLIDTDQAYTGGTVITQGTVQIGAANGRNTTGTFGAGDIALNPASGGTAALSILRGDNALVVANKITSSSDGTNSIVIGITGATSPSGIVTFSGSNTFTGNVTIAGGALKITNRSALGVGTKTVSIGSNAGPALLLDGSGGNISLDPSISYTASSDGTVADTAANAGAIVNLAGDNVIGGTVSLVNGGGGQGRISVQGGTLQLAGTINADGATGTRTLQIGGSGIGTISGAIADGTTGGAARVVSVAKDGAGTWKLTGLNTFTGAVAAQAGTLSVNFLDANGAAQPLGKATSAVTLGTTTTTATLEYTGSADATLGRALTVTASGPGATVRNSGGGLLTLGGAVSSSGSVLTLTGGKFEVTGVISGTAAQSNLVLDNASAKLSAANTYKGTTTVANGSTLKNGATNALPTTTVLALGAPGGTSKNTYDLNGFDATIAGFAANAAGEQVITNSAASGTNILSVTAGGTFAGVVQDGPAAVTGLTKSTGGSLTLTGLETYTGPTTVSGGTLVVAAGLAATASVRVSGGTLQLGANDALNHSATLELAGGTLATGNFGATAGSFTLSGNSAIDFGAGSGSSLLFAGLGAHVAGALLNISNWSGTDNTTGSASDDRLLFTGNAQDFVNSYAQSEVLFNGAAGYSALQYDANHYEVAAVPEPGTTGLLAFAGLLGLTRRRRRRAAASSGPAQS